MTKDQFHRKYSRVLREVGKVLAPGEFQVRSNRGGSGIMGEVILHTPTCYVQVSGDFSVGGCNVMYRSCQGMKDYVGGTNRWMRLETLDDREAAIRAFREASAQSGREPRYPAQLA